MDLYYCRILVAGRFLKSLFFVASDERDLQDQVKDRFSMTGAAQVALIVSATRLPAPLSRFIRLFALKPPPEKAKAQLLRQLSVLLKAGVPVDDCLRDLAIAYKENKRQDLYPVVRKLKVDLTSGLQFGDAMARQPEIFQRVVLHLVRVGDQTGCIDDALRDAAAYVEKSAKSKSDFMRAMIYPVTTFAAIFGAAAFWLVYVVPGIASMFKQMKVELPTITVATIAASDWLSQWWHLIGIVLLAGVVAHVLVWGNSPRYRLKIYRALSHVPVIGKTLIKRSACDLFRVLGILYDRGIDIMSSLDIAGETLSNDFHRQIFNAFASRIRLGHTFSESMNGRKLFPFEAATIVGAGERSGTLGTQLMYLASVYEAELDELVENVNEIMKPLVVVVAGAFFVFMLVALLLPVYDLIRQTMSAMN